MHRPSSTSDRPAPPAETPDARLLADFDQATGPAAEAAFATLVDRHGPMVLRTCRALLGDAGAADDAFQATFLVLMRRAGALDVRGSVGPWLHEVASRVCAAQRTAGTRRERHEQKAARLTPS